MTIYRKQYISGEKTFDEFYGQFVTNQVAEVVRVGIGEDLVKASTDQHFNDIPLAQWDRLYGLIQMLVGRDVAEANGGGGVSLSDTVCVAKAAAKLIRGW